MNMPVKVKKLLGSNNKEDVILGLQIFCKINDNPEFDKMVSELPNYRNMLKNIKITYKDIDRKKPASVSVGYFFKYKGTCFLASTFSDNIFKVRDFDPNRMLYEYE